MDRIASKDKCTGCGACAYTCPNQCITMHERGVEGWLPTLNLTNCIDCGKCTKVCPVKTQVDKHKQVDVFASWHIDSEMRRKCASSGTASAMYQKALKKGWFIGGAVSVNALDVEMQLCSEDNAIQEFYSSKYIFSYSDKIYVQIKQALAENKVFLFIGLPCQVAAIHNLFKSKRDQMILVDLVCHGTNTKEYLKQHIAHVADAEKVKKVIFREGERFLIKMLDKKGKVVYEESSWYKDMYQFGYHKGIFYRQNCYLCQYASAERVSDITLKDYWGLGEMTPIDYPRERVSAVLINTDRGLNFFNECIEEGFVIAYKRPLDEPIKGDGQLQHPVSIKSEKLNFEQLMMQNGNDFESAMKVVAVQTELKENQLRRKNARKACIYAFRSKIYHLIVDCFK